MAATKAAQVVWKGPLEDLPSDHAELVVHCQCLVGEAATWSTRENSLYWIDIEGKKLWRLRWEAVEESERVFTWELPKRAGSFALCLSEDYPMLMAFEDGFALYNPETSDCKYLASPYRQVGNVRLNDGRTDPKGRFICGAINLDHIDEPLDVWKAAVKAYQLPHGEAEGREILSHHTFRNYNGTGFTPDGRTMYCTDSPLRVIWAFDYDLESGELSNQREFAQVKEPGVPDGATVDSDGNLWSAVFWEGAVNKYDSRTGGLMERVELVTAKRTTCPCIGGPHMDTLFITSAGIGLSEQERVEQPHAGGLFAIKLAHPESKEPARAHGRGVPSAYFKHKACVA